MIAKCGTNCLRHAAATPQWTQHDSLDLWHQRTRWNTLRFTTPEPWYWGYYGCPSVSSGLDGMDIYSTPRPVCCHRLSTRQWGRPLDRLMAKHKTAVTPLLTHWSYWSLVLSDWDLVRKCEVWLEIVTCRALTRKTETHGGPVCDVV